MLSSGLLPGLMDLEPEPVSKIGQRTIEELFRAAGLFLTADRLRVVAPQMEALLIAANELSESMAQPSRMGVVPAICFTHRSDPAQRE